METKPNKGPMMTRSDAIGRYGEIEEGKWKDEAKWCVNLCVPPGLKWLRSGLPVNHIYCNKDMAPPLLRALQNVQDRGLVDQLKTFDGCFQIRPIRGGTSQSAHSYAAAIDINAATNQLGCDGDMSSELAKCFTDEGFTWGKTFSRKDPMHMSWLSW